MTAQIIRGALPKELTDDEVALFIHFNSKPPRVITLSGIHVAEGYVRGVIRDDKDVIAWFIYEADGVCRRFSFLVA
jgi:hypothetical protein